MLVIAAVDGVKNGVNGVSAGHCLCSNDEALLVSANPFWWWWCQSTRFDKVATEG